MSLMKVLQSKQQISIFLLSWAWGFHLTGLSYYLFGTLIKKLCTCSKILRSISLGEASYSGLILLDPSTYIQDYKNGQSCMENSSSPVRTWLLEPPKEFLW